MRVDVTHDAAQSLAPAAATHPILQTNFRSALDCAKQNHQQLDGRNTPSQPAQASDTAGSSGSRAPAAPMTPLEYLTDYLRKTPVQHMREAILKKMGLTEEELAAMPPERRAAVEQAIAEKIQELLRQQTGNAQIHRPAGASIMSLLT